MTDGNRINLADLGLLLMRLMLAVVFLFHGSQKLFGIFGGDGIMKFAENLSNLGIPLPTIAAWAAALAEFGAGVFLLVGNGMRIAVIPAIFVMLVAVIRVHPDSFSGPKGTEYPLTLAVMLAGLALIGPGRFTFRGIAGKSP
ncbi:MAG: DoxX family protein [Phycisphaerales bacterium]|nr:DoxX family protein [Phycisphaerales bacterium]